MIYVACIDNGYEGKSAPVIAFKAASEARAGIALLNADASTRWVLYEVPVWPEPVNGPYYDIKPILDEALPK